MNNEKKDTKPSNVIKVPPRRYQVNHKGFHGWIEYKPSDNKWHWSSKVQFTITNTGEEKTQAEAELELKKYLATASASKHARSVD